jgi:hypothetical protein
MAVTSPLLSESLLILSDVHLGNDLNDLARDGARRSQRVDVDLVSLLGHYRKTPPAGQRWRLVIAGDFIDFIGMAILPSAGDLDTASNAEEREHGLGNTAAHGRLKLRAVAARHRIVFQAVAAFVADGHALTIVHGNHDVEFHWDGVKDELKKLLLEMAPTKANDDAQSATDFADRIRGFTTSAASPTSSTATSTTSSAPPRTSWRRSRRAIRGASRGASPTCCCAGWCVPREACRSTGTTAWTWATT